MKHPKRTNSAEFINLGNRELTSPNFSSETYENLQIQMAIVDFKLKDLSYRDIQEIVLRTYSRSISKEFISQTLTVAGKRAKWLNRYYDSLVIPKINILECDEVFQGQQTCLFGAAEKWSSYLVSLDFLPDRGHDAIKAQFEKFKKHIENLDIIITDGLASYPGVLDDMLEEIIHLQCQVHAMRNIYKEQEIFKRAAKTARAAAKKQDQSLVKQKIDLKEKRQDLRNLKRKFERWIVKRDNYYKNHGIKKNSRKAPWTPRRKYLAKILNHLRASIRSKKITIENLTKRISATKQDLSLFYENFDTKRQINLQTGRLVAEFKALLASSSETYLDKKQRFVRILSSSQYNIAPILLKFLENHPRLFNLQINDLDHLLSPNFRNSNTIERIFSLIRSFLNKIKSIAKTETGYALLELLRFRHNFSPPKTGMHRHESPLMRMGVQSKYCDYLNALFSTETPIYTGKDPTPLKWSQSQTKTAIAGGTT